nr:MAG TPA: hypothetical protein [Caudoviricetes sp.]
MLGFLLQYPPCRLLQDRRTDNPYYCRLGSGTYKHPPPRTCRGSRWRRRTF